MPMPLSTGRLSDRWECRCRGARGGERRQVCCITSLAIPDEVVNYWPCGRLPWPENEGRCPMAGPGQEQLPVTVRGRRTRAALLQAGRELFEERGFADVSIDQVVE